MEKLDFKSLAKENNGPIVDAAGFKSGFDKIFAPYKKTDEQKIVKADAEPAPTPVPPPANLHTEKELAEAKAKGFEDGYAKGFRDAKSAADELNKKIDENLHAIFIKMAEVQEAKRFEDEKDIGDVAQVVVSIARKVSDAALLVNASDSVEKVVRKSFKMLFDEPKLIISVCPDVASFIGDRIAALAKAEGFKGEVEIKIGQNISSGGCHIEWQGGGLRSDKDTSWSEIDKLVKDCFVKGRKKVN